MNTHTKVTPLPSGLLDALRLASEPSLMPTYASLDKQSRDELRVSARKMLTMIDQSETWRPDLLATALAIPVRTQAHADLVLQHLHKHGCDQYVHDTTSTPISAIFVNKAGRLSFLFQGETKNLADYLNNKERGHKVVDADLVLGTKSISEIDALPVLAAA
jgi:hypothetical protein